MALINFLSAMQQKSAGRKITALIHTHNDALRIGRALESLRPCDEVLVIDHGDHGSTDNTQAIAREYGASVVVVGLEVASSEIAAYAKHEWLLCLLPTESVAEGLEASLLEWKLQESSAPVEAFAVGLVDDTQGWTQLPPETRLVHRQHAHWNGNLPANQPGPVLEGFLLRLSFP